jgi:hypothetical protein
MWKRLLVVLVSGLALALPGAAAANPPQLLTIDQVGRHPIAQFSIPGVDLATIYFATKPDRASDGSFLQENITDADLLTDPEIQSGSWTYESQLDPGTYYVLLYASDFDCIGQPTCLNGYSNVLTLHVPKPPRTYRGSVSVMHFTHVAFLRLGVKPLGDSLPYKVCWRLKNKRRRCVTRKVNGYSWNEPAFDTVTVGLRGMAKRTTFSWYVHGRRVATRTANTTIR